MGGRRRWEEGGGGQGKPAEIDFTGGLAGGDEDDDQEDGWRFAVILDWMGMTRRLRVWRSLRRLSLQSVMSRSG